MPIPPRPISRSSSYAVESTRSTNGRSSVSDVVTAGSDTRESATGGREVPTLVYHPGSVQNRDAPIRQPDVCPTTVAQEDVATPGRHGGSVECGTCIPAV